MNQEALKGKFDNQDVFFGPISRNDASGLSVRKQMSDQTLIKETVWVTNTKGKDMTTLLPLDSAKYLVNRQGSKFRYALEEEIPYVPKVKIYPFDPEKKIQAQERATVEISGAEVAELSKLGIDPLEGVVSYKEMRLIAKENGIKVSKLKKAELTKLLREKGLIE